MKKTKYNVHPYMPNSAGNNKEKMLNAIGAENIDELFIQIPEKHRLSR